MSFEELGKLEMLDHMGFEAMANGLINQESRVSILKHLFDRKMFYSHKMKQSWGVYGGRGSGHSRRIESHITSGMLDIHKQDSFYVGYSGSKIRLPSRFSAFHAYKQLDFTLGLFKSMEDMPFVPYFATSSEESLEQARQVFEPLEAMFAALVKPRKNSV